MSPARSRAGPRKPAGSGRRRNPPKPSPKSTEPHRPKRCPDLSKIKGAKKAALPDFIEPTLATLVASAPAGERWLHEIKFDGYRLQARLEAGRVKLSDAQRPRLDQEVRQARGDRIHRILPAGKALIDGELVVETSFGASDFSALQADLSEGRSDRFVFYVSTFFISTATICAPCR